MTANTEQLGVKAAKGAAWISVEMIGVQLASLLVFIVMSRYLSPTAFGVIGIAYIVVQVIQSAVINNLTILVSKAQQPTALQFDTTFWLSVVIACVCFALVNLGVSLYAWFYPQQTWIDALRGMSVVLLFYGCTKAHEAWFIRFFKFKTLALRGILASVFSGLVGILFAIKGYGIDAIIVQQILLNVCSFLLMYHQCPWQPSMRFCFTTCREIIQFNAKLFPSALSYTINQNLDSVLIASLFGVTSVGYYSVAKRLRLAAQMVFFTPIKGVILSSLAEIQADEARLVKNFVKGLMVLTALMLPLYLVLAVIADEVILSLFGEQWRKSGTFLSFLAIANIFTSLIFYIENLFVIKGRPTLNNIASVGYTSVMVGLFFVLPSSEHSIGYALLLPYLLIFPMLLNKVSGLLHVSQWSMYQQIGRVLLASLLVSAAAYGLFMQPYLGSVAIKMVCAAVCLPVIYYLALKKIAPMAFQALMGLILPLLTGLTVKKLS